MGAGGEQLLGRAAQATLSNAEPATLGKTGRRLPLTWQSGDARVPRLCGRTPSRGAIALPPRPAGSRPGKTVGSCAVLTSRQARCSTEAGAGHAPGESSGWWLACSSALGIGPRWTAIIAARFPPRRGAHAPVRADVCLLWLARPNGVRGGRCFARVSSTSTAPSMDVPGPSRRCAAVPASPRQGGGALPVWLPRLRAGHGDASHRDWGVPAPVPDGLRAATAAAGDATGIGQTAAGSPCASRASPVRAPDHRAAFSCV